MYGFASHCLHFLHGSIACEAMLYTSVAIRWTSISCIALSAIVGMWWAPAYPSYGHSVPIERTPIIPNCASYKPPLTCPFLVLHSFFPGHFLVSSYALPSISASSHATQSRANDIWPNLPREVVGTPCPLHSLLLSSKRFVCGFASLLFCFGG